MLNFVCIQKQDNTFKTSTYLVITSLNVLELFLRTSFESFFEVVDLDELMFYAKQCLMYRVSLD